MLDKSKKTVYRYLDDIPLEFVREFVNVKVNDKGVKVKYITDECVLYLQKRYLSDLSEDSLSNDTPEIDTCENDLVFSLLEQLKQKDIQLAEKDKQINMLMEQSKNYQVLLQGQQMLSLPEKKKSIFKRLFSRSEDE